MARHCNNCHLVMCRTWWRKFSQRIPSTGFDSRMQNDDGPVFQYATENTKRAPCVYSWGFAELGALGIRRFVKPKKGQVAREFVYRPNRMSFADKCRIEKIACGYGFTLLADKYRVYGTGLNSDSQIGFHRTSNAGDRSLELIAEPHIIPLQLYSPGSTQILQLACGRAHSLILTEEGVFSLGNNAYGQCGRPVIEKEKYSSNPIITKVDIDGEKIAKVSCGLDHSLFLTESGQIFSCGWGADGQTGLGHYKSEHVPGKVEGDIVGEKIVSMASSADCNLAISDDGQLFGWGNSEYKQLTSAVDSTQVNISRHLPMPAAVGKVKQAAVGSSMSIILNEDGDVFVWGFGILGLGPSVTQSDVPIQVPPTLFGRTQFAKKIRVSQVAAGVKMCAAVNNEGSLFTWGTSMYGNLGLATKTQQRFFPLQVSVPSQVLHLSLGVDHCVALCRSFS